MVVDKTVAPMYDERFRGYGMNKESGVALFFDAFYAVLSTPGHTVLVRKKSSIPHESCVRSRHVEILAYGCTIISQENFVEFCYTVILNTEVREFRRHHIQAKKRT